METDSARMGNNIIPVKGEAGMYAILNETYRNHQLDELFTTVEQPSLFLGTFQLHSRILYRHSFRLDRQMDICPL